MAIHVLEIGSERANGGTVIQCGDGSCHVLALCLAPAQIMEPGKQPRKIPVVESADVRPDEGADRMTIDHSGDLTLTAGTDVRHPTRSATGRGLRERGIADATVGLRVAAAAYNRYVDLMGMLWEVLKAVFVDKTLLPPRIREHLAKRRRRTTTSR